MTETEEYIQLKFDLENEGTKLSDSSTTSAKKTPAYDIVQRRIEELDEEREERNETYSRH